MIGFWVPIIVIILNSGNPSIIYDDASIFQGEDTCRQFAQTVVSSLPLEVTLGAISISSDCIFIRDSRLVTR